MVSVPDVGHDSTGRPRLIVGLTGASAPHLGIHLLRALRDLGTIETHLVISGAAYRTVELESGMRATQVAELADVLHQRGDIAASIASGSFATLGMAIVPCSMRTLAAVATGFSDNLVTRAADVVLKERRTLVLAPRETPLNLIQLRNMVSVTEAGAVVLPPTPAFYQNPESIDDLLAHLTGKVLDQFGIQHNLFQRWSGSSTNSEGTTR